MALRKTTLAATSRLRSFNFQETSRKTKLDGGVGKKQVTKKPGQKKKSNKEQLAIRGEATVPKIEPKLFFQENLEETAHRGTIHC